MNFVLVLFAQARLPSSNLLYIETVLFRSVYREENKSKYYSDSFSSCFKLFVQL